MDTKIIHVSTIVSITRKLVDTIFQFISMENKKNEVDELTENVAILYRKELYAAYSGNSYEYISGLNITEVIEKLAHSKVKDYKSLTNKTIFKFMDMIDM